ncbi:hypothetical protein AB1Y20_022633 [Prymnesium parvum]|uniref:Cilia- and flagella-associated protein 157 n=1 Tax=Prymnesium parvum TaxID=97485 RepID=A0AB34JK72_PRYPA
MSKAAVAVADARHTVSFVRQYAPDRPRLSPALMQRVGGGYKELPPFVLDEVQSLHAIVDGLQFEKEKLERVLRERDSELAHIKSELRDTVSRLALVEHQEAQREAAMHKDKQRTRAQLEETQRELQSELSSAVSDRSRFMDEVRRLTAQLDEATIQADSRKRQISELLTHMAEQENLKENKLLQTAGELAQARAAVLEGRRQLSIGEEQLAERDRQIELLKSSVDNLTLEVERLRAHDADLTAELEKLRRLGQQTVHEAKQQYIQAERDLRRALYDASARDSRERDALQARLHQAEARATSTAQALEEAWRQRDAARNDSMRGTVSLREQLKAAKEQAAALSAQLAQVAALRNEKEIHRLGFESTVAELKEVLISTGRDADASKLQLVQVQ